MKKKTIQTTDAPQAIGTYSQGIRVSGGDTVYVSGQIGLDPISMGVICNLIRTLNDALGATSIVVTHDVHESFELVDYVYFVSEGVVVAEGTPDELRESTMPFVHQFVRGEVDGPVPFHYAAPDYRQDLLRKENV